MSDKKIKEMLAGIIKVADYDLYKSLFVSPEEPDIADDCIDKMVSVVKEFHWWC